MKVGDLVRIEGSKYYGIFLGWADTNMSTKHGYEPSVASILSAGKIRAVHADYMLAQSGFVQ